MGEWKEYQLGEIALFKTGKLNSNAAEVNGKYPFFTCSPETLYINDFAFDQKAILLAGNNAEGKFNVKYYEGKFNAYQRTYIIWPRDNRTNIIYLFYALKLCLESFRLLSQGTSTKFLTASILNSFVIKIPSYELQCRIASILKSLDDKIENNRRINENLEQQAQALFKSWFVDFEPFRDQPFVDSELGMIPEGWRVGTVSDWGKYIASGGTPKSLKKEYYEGSIRWFSTKELKDSYLFDSEKHISEEAFNNSSVKMFPCNSVLMAMYGATVGRLGILTLDSCFNQAAVGIVPKDEIGAPYIYLYLFNERINLINLASGAAQQNLSVGVVKDFKVLIPSVKTLYDFNQIIGSIFNSIKNYTKESINLAQLRDTLLPKLMSGEINLDNIPQG